MKVLFFPALFFFSNKYAKILIIAANIISLFRINGLPKFQALYWEKIRKSEFFWNILYIACLSVFYNQTSLIFMLPIAIHCLVGLCEFTLKVCASYSFIQNQWIQSSLLFITNNRNAILLAKSKVEIFMHIYLLLCLFLRYTVIFQVIQYSILLYTKRRYNEKMNQAVEGFKQFADFQLPATNLPDFLKTVLSSIIGLYYKGFHLGGQ